MLIRVYLWLIIAIRRASAHTEKTEQITGLHVLVYQNRVSIRVGNHKASRAGSAFVCF